ncbi:MAG TPA: TRAP transporter substrate-binding protein DctP [Verrucomicrobiae bacterium]|nr:TRAP transporter substrate-binding protein DctP [Verrucomicrobiae bacterium]
MSRKVLLGSILCGLAAAAHAQKVEIIMATLAPQDSTWYKVMERMGEDWKNISQGNVHLSIRAGGVVGDEPECVRRLNSHSIQAAGLTGAGLGDIDQGVACLQIPMMFESYEELDYVRNRMAPQLEQRIEQKGYLVLNWGDAGWVQFFSTKPVNRLADLRKLKLFTWAGDPVEQDLWEANGFRVVPLPGTEIVNQLRTHGLEAVPMPALYVETSSLYDYTRYMCDVKWAPLVGATIVSRDVWNKIPADQRVLMLASARKSGEALKKDIRDQGDEAIVTMTNGKPGQRSTRLTVTHLDAAALAEWRQQTEAIYPRMKGKMVPADLFDEVQRLRDEYRAQHRSGGPATAGGKAK